MITTIQLSNITLEAFCGCLPRERTHPVQLQVQIRISLSLDIGDGPERDALENTLDYRKVLYTLRHLADVRHYSLLESFAESCARAVYNLHPHIRSVEVSVSKPGALPEDVLPTVTAVFGAL